MTKRDRDLYVQGRDVVRDRQTELRTMDNPKGWATSAAFDMAEDQSDAEMIHEGMLDAMKELGIR